MYVWHYVEVIFIFIKNTSWQKELDYFKKIITDNLIMDNWDYLQDNEFV